MAEIVFFDMWEHASLPADQIDHPLALGRSPSADVLKHMQLERDDLSIVTNDNDGFGLPKGWTQMRGDIIGLLFDENDRWQSMTYGKLGDDLTWQVESAITREAGVGAPDATAGEMPLIVRGRSLGELATLPNFMRMNAFCDPGHEPPLWSITGREYDKWMSVSTRLPYADISAEFLLKFNKPVYESRFEVDYCLNKLHISRPWPVEDALVSAHPA